MKKILTLGIAALAIAGTGCKKTGDDKNPTPQVPEVPVKTKTDFLTTGKWQMTELYDLYITATDTQKMDYFEDIEECNHDNTIAFAKDGTYKIDLGTIQCDSTEGDWTIGGGSWMFIDADTRIVLKAERSNFGDTMNVEITESMLNFATIYYDDVGKGTVHEIQGFKNVK